jgi:hypothetical protein
LLSDISVREEEVAVYQKVAIAVLAIAMSTGLAQAMGTGHMHKHRHMAACADGQQAAATCLCGTAANGHPATCKKGQWCHAPIGACTQ